MIKAKSKPMEEIVASVREFERILVVGCNGCVAMCDAGGLKETLVLASALRLGFMKSGEPKRIDELSLTRQCEKEFLSEIRDRMGDYDAVLSLACGAGVQFMAEMYHDKPVVPALDTCFIGVTEEMGVWSERCQACGKCVLAETAGICPVARCAKRMLNGPCGGSKNGLCEIGKCRGAGAREQGGQQRNSRKGR